MRIVVVGAGPAGLYFSLLMKKLDPDHEVEVLERNPPDATYGWGVVFSEETLGALRDADPKSFTDITDAFATWDAIDVRYGGETVRSRGHAFSAIARRRLLRILQDRCRELGVELRFEDPVDDPAALTQADLLVGADGVNSTVRRSAEDAFGPSRLIHGTRYIWFGTDLVLRAFTFIFRRNAHGLFQVHGYPFDARTSTFIVECPEETWRRAGLEGATEEESIAFCEDLFAEDLAGHRLMSNRSAWMSFVTLRNETWHRDRTVLLGDAAHTAHFTIGSGTKLAMEDAVSLVAAFERHGTDVASALRDYEMERQPVVERFQQAALESAAYFENVSRYASFEAVQFAFNLLTRSGRITHLELEKRDPAFVASVDRWFAGTSRPSAGPDRPRDTPAPLVPAPPALAPFALAGEELANRLAVSLRAGDDAGEGVPGPVLKRRVLAAAATGAGLLVTEPVAVESEGRIAPGSPELADDAQEAAWVALLREVRAAGPAKVAALLSHAGRRGATRSRREGLDRPLADGTDWPLVAASPIPYTSRGRVPSEAGPSDLKRLREAFARAARAAARAGFDVLELDMGHGYLLAGFLSPLSNRRGDRYGGMLANRMRFPLEVLDRVREAWPADRPLTVRLTATDWAPGALTVDDAVAVARELRARGCDLVHVVAGQTIEHDRPQYGRFYLVPLSDRIRNEAGIATLVGGYLTTRDEVDTILAAGRADLCALTAGLD